jgi:hypothetical protein
MLLLLCGLVQAEPTLDDLLREVDDMWRSQSAHAVLQIHVVTKRYERSIKLETWSRGETENRILILEPEKDAGTITIMKGDKAYQVMPRLNRAIRLPLAMMGARWMGTHLSNNDLLGASRFVEDYTCELGRETEAISTINCTPKDDAPVPWGKVEIDLDKALAAAVALRFYEEDGALARTLRFSEHRILRGSPVAHKIEVFPASKPKESTTIVYETLELDIPLEDSLFVLPQDLK